MTVEIEDREYEVAPRTVEIAEKLAEIEKAHEGKPLYKLWLAELDILLGKDACRELFKDGRRENIDRLQRIFAGVSRAFLYTAEEVEAEAGERRIEALSAALAPVNELLRNVRALDKAEDGRKTIKRG
jgi:hypothetical protein